MLPNHTFKSFQSPPFRLFFSAMLAHRASMNMQMMVRSLLVYRLTGSAAILGAMSFAHLLPMLFTSLHGGAIADRAQKKHIIMLGELIMAVVALLVGITLTTGYLKSDHGGSLWILVAASVIQGTVMGLALPSQQAILPEIVGEEQLMNAVSLNAITMNIMRILAPAAAGFLIDFIGFDAVYYTMTAMYLITVALMVKMPRTSPIHSRKSNALFDIKEGIQYIRNDITILLLLLFTLVGVILSMPYVMLMPIFADDILKVGATGLGILMSVSGIGAIISSLVLATLPNKKRGWMLLISSLILGFTLLCFSFSNNWYLSLGLISLVGLGHTARMALSNTMLQYYTEVKYRGRVMSIFMMEFGLMSFGSFAAGLLTEAVGVQWALGSFSMVFLFISILAIIYLPRIRKLD